jgi:hypothetical protein
MNSSKIILLLLLLAAHGVAAGTIEIDRAGEGLLVSGYGMDGKQYFDCNTSCNVSFNETEGIPLVEVHKVYELLDCNYSLVKDSINGLINSTQNISSSVYSLGQRNDSPVCSMDSKELRDWITNDADTRLGKVRDIISVALQQYQGSTPQQNPSSFSNMSIENVRLAAEAQYQRQQTDAVVSENAQLQSSNGSLMWIAIGSLVVALVSVSSPWVPSILRRMGIGEQGMNSLRQKK